MKARLIVNPTSGTNQGPDYLQSINQRLRERLGDVDIVMTVGPGDASAAAAQAASEDYDLVIVGGGDGTLNEVLNGLGSVPGAFDRVTLGLVPLGTGNDFAQALGISEDVDAALDVLLQGRAVSVDLGELNGRKFINVSAGGFIAEVSEATSPELKTIAGKLAYLVGGAQVLMEYEPVQAHMLCAADRASCEQIEMPLQFFAVCNSRLVGGGREIAPEAIINDGWLDVCLVGQMPTLEFLGLLAKVSGGDHLEDPRVLYFRARNLVIDFASPMKVNTDGEVLETSRCEYRVLPGAVRFLAGDAPFAAGTPGAAENAVP